jgi:hypothetical protein
MSAGPPINSEAPAIPPPEGTRAEGSQRSSSPAGWFSGWTLFVLFLLYPLSIMPAYVVLLVLRSHGIDVYATYETFYWPVIWVLRNVQVFRYLNDLIEPALRGLVR